MGLLFFYICLALGVSFLCSIMEAVLLSTSASFVVRLEQSQPKLGKKLVKYKSNIDEPLAAILSLNTIAHTGGAAGAGAQAALVFGDSYIGVISAILTLLILVISEIIPKTLGAAYWRELNPTVIRLLGMTIISMWPLVKMAEVLTRMIGKGKGEKLVHRDEFIALAELGNKEGIFNRYESRVLQNLFYLRDITVRDIMTPRTVVFALRENTTIKECLTKHERFSFSRIPVFKENLDDITGFVLKSDIFAAGRENPETKLADICRPIVVVSGDLALHDLFEELMSESNHIALVVDMYGGTEGVVTIEDFIETLLGLEIVDEIDKAEDMQVLARKKWRERAERSGLITRNLPGVIPDEATKEQDTSIQ